MKWASEIKQTQIEIFEKLKPLKATEAADKEIIQTGTMQIYIEVNRGF